MTACLICPHCRARLHQIEQRFVCPRGHDFDIAREGYLNLLPPRRRAAAQVGDRRDMLLARRRFLAAGHYRFLSDALNAVVSEHLRLRARNDNITVLDAGCGEGYYLERLQYALRHVLPSFESIQYLGLDIARDAARLAARHYPEIQFMVADTHVLIPCVDASVDVLLNVFAPRNVTEFSRIAAPDGLLVIVIPTSTHLQELRSIVPLLSIQQDKRETVLDTFAVPFWPVDEKSIEHTVELVAEDLQDLVAMMPSIRHLTPDSLTPLGSVSRQVVTFSFEMLAFERR